jgi:hypothetical protein
MNNPNQPTDPQNQSTSSPSNDNRPQYTDWRDMRRAARQERREQRYAMRGYRHNGWIGGVVLIALGVIFLVQNLTGFTLANWWALFILIPAFGAFTNAWYSYNSNGRLTASGRGSLIVGLGLTLLSAAFLFNLDLRTIGPVFLILAGGALLVSTLLPD